MSSRKADPAAPPDTAFASRHLPRPGVRTKYDFPHYLKDVERFSEFISGLGSGMVLRILSRGGRV
jgi:hypothetical protein